MLRKLWLALILSLVAGADAKDLLTRSGGGGVAAGGGACAEAATFLARTSGENTAAVTNLICGLKSDGVITGNLGTTGCGSKLDILRVYAMQNSTDALLNICKTAFGATVPNSLPTFTANVGFTGAAADNTHTLDSGFNPNTASGNCLLNSCALGVWQISPGDSGNYVVGASSGSPTSITRLWPSLSGNVNCAVNTDGNASNAVATPDGFYICNRTDSSHMEIYKNGALLVNVSSFFSTGLPNVNIAELGVNNSGTVDASGLAQLAVFLMSSSLSSGDVTALKNRLCTYLIAVGAVGSC